MHNTPFADMNDSERETQATGFQVFERLDHALPLLGSFVEAMKTNPASIERRIQKSMATITELADPWLGPRVSGSGRRIMSPANWRARQWAMELDLMSCHGTCLLRRSKMWLDDLQT